MLYVLTLLIGLGVGTRFGYYLKNKEIAEGSLVEALVPEELEKGINKVTGKDIFEADMDKGSNND